MTALRDQIAALLTRLGGQKQPQAPRAAKIAPSPRKVQDEFYIDFLNRHSIREGDEIVFWGTKDDWNAIVQSTAHKFPDQINLGQLFRWYKDQCPLKESPLGYLKARGKGWKILRASSKKREVYMTFFLRRLGRTLIVKLNLTPAEWA